MSFFDDDDPPTRSARPRRPTASRAAGSRAARPRPSGGGGASADQQLLIRRAIALGVGVLVLILLVIGVNSCRTSARKNALRDYNRDVSALIRESDKDVGQSFFALFGSASSPVELETQINQFRVRAEDEAGRAKNFSVPGNMVGAQRNLLTVLNFRAEALGAIANRIRTARSSGNGASDATTQIAGQMQKFLASDVVYSQRVAPLIKQELDDNEITGQGIAASSFLPNLGWLDPATVARRIGGRAASGAKGGPVAPGLHGHGLTSVKVGTVELQPSPTPNRIPAGANVAFDVTFANQGTNDESDVNVRVRVTGGGKPITVTKSVTQTRQGASASVSVPLGQAPPIGTPVTIEVTVGAVPGEKKTDNNKQSYTAIFTR